MHPIAVIEGFQRIDIIQPGIPSIHLAVLFYALENAPCHFGILGVPTAKSVKDKDTFDKFWS
jgi:hypothetical protein